MKTNPRLSTQYLSEYVSLKDFCLQKLASLPLSSSLRTPAFANDQRSCHAKNVTMEIVTMKFYEMMTSIFIHTKEGQARICEFQRLSNDLFC